MSAANARADVAAAPFYRPFVGADYAAGPGPRTLILGESFARGGEDADGPDQALANHFARRDVFFARLEAVLGGEAADGAARRAVWRRLAFTNLVQAPMRGAANRPSAGQFAAGWRSFPAVLAAMPLPPDVVLCFSRTGWDMLARLDPLPRHAQNRLAAAVGSGRAALAPPPFVWDCADVVPGHRLLVAGFDHPSYMRRKPDDAGWRAWAAAVLAAAPAVLAEVG